MSPIIKRGRLVVAVDENTEGLASRDSEGHLVGLEIDLVNAIAAAIGPNVTVDLRPVVTEDKTNVVKQNKVDMTVSAVSMTCERLQDVLVQQRVLHRRHEFLVRGRARQAATDLAGTTRVHDDGLDVDRHPRGLDAATPAEPRLVDARTDCLVALQEGAVDAYFGHETFLFGMVDQDPGADRPAGRSAALRHRGRPGQRHAGAVRQRGPGPVA